MAALSYRPTAPRGVVPLVDVYIPDTPGPHPSAVLVHGGAFLIGSRKMKPIRYLATRLVEAGFAVAAVDYRLIFRGGRLEEAVDDVRVAIAWWCDQAERFELDAARISALGFSAGAALLWLATAGSGASLHRLVSVYGLYDFTWLSGRRAAWLRRKLLRTTDRDVWRARSPMANATCPAPALVIHGTADRMAPFAHAEALARTRDQLGLSTTVRLVNGARHGFLNHAGSRVAETSVAEIVTFLSGDALAEADAGLD